MEGGHEEVSAAEVLLSLKAPNYVTQVDVDMLVEARKPDLRLTQPALRPEKGPGSYFHTHFYLSTT